MQSAAGYSTWWLVIMSYVPWQAWKSALPMELPPMMEFAAAAKAGQLPSYTMIDPNFHVGQTNDDHPPTSISYGQTMVQQILDALMSNADAWLKTLFIVIYDEHGGIYDHVTPGLAGTYVSGALSPVEITYGVRIPAFVISPWVLVKASSNIIFDHTSVLKTVIARFCPDDPAILGDRVPFANDLGPLLSLDALQLNRSGIAVTNLPPGGITKLDPSATLPTPSPAAPPAGVAAGAATQPTLSRAATLQTTQADAHETLDRVQQLIRP